MTCIKEPLITGKKDREGLVRNFVYLCEKYLKEKGSNFKN